MEMLAGEGGSETSVSVKLAKTWVQIVLCLEQSDDFVELYSILALKYCRYAEA